MHSPTAHKLAALGKNARMERNASSFAPEPPGAASPHLIQPRPRRRSGWLRPLFYLLALCAVAFIVWRVYTNKKLAARQKEDDANALMSQPVPVQTAPIVQRVMPIYLTALGTVTPYNSVTVKARVNGQLDKVNFAEGQQVKAGQTIMVVDPKPFK